MKRIAIIMVDDDEIARVLFEDAVEEAREYVKDISFSVDGVDLLERLRRQGEYASMEEEALPDLVVLDLSMPRMDGYQLLEELGKDKAFENIPIVVMSTTSDEQEVKRCYSLGAAGFIVKPASMEERLKAVKSLASYWSNIMAVPRRVSY
ncbi:MAG: two-component system response regulator [Hyphomicrobiales bacterium]|nr:MAG: two-component system response regulator [Hyphomicrobiales bacterium]